MSRATDEARRNMEASGDFFADRLRHFVQTWAPDDRYRRDKFQQGLMRLFVDAVAHQTSCMAFGTETYASGLHADRAMRSLTVDHGEPEMKDITGLLVVGAISTACFDNTGVSLSMLIGAVIVAIVDLNTRASR
jgi:hypothetical protein